MKFISILSIFLLCNSCIIHIKATIHSNNKNYPPFDRELQPGITNGTTKLKTKFTDLNSDVLFLIFTEFDLHGLVYVTKAIPQMLPFAHVAFQRNYKDYVVRIMQTDTERPFHDSVWDKHIELYALRKSVDTLEIFGSIISKLFVLNRYISDDHSSVISQCINKHCADSLNDLNLHFIKANTFRQFTVPFNNVEVLVFYVADQKQINSGRLTLSELFPKVKLMKLGIHADIDYSFIEFEFPHLENLFVVATNGGFKGINHITELLKKNPQIRHIDLTDFPHNYIGTINNYLPLVENLTLDTIDLSVSVHFEYIKNLEVAI